MTVPARDQPGASLNEGLGPRWDLRQGDIVSLGALHDSTLRHLEFDRVIPGRPGVAGQPGRQRLLKFQEIPDGALQFLSDLEIAQLSKEGRFRIEAIDESDGRSRGDLPTALDLTSREEAYIARHWKYVEVCRSLKPFRKNHATLKPLLEAVADAHGETPPSTSTTFRNYDAYLERGGLLGTAAIVPKRGRGNRNRPWSPALIDKLRDCLYRALRLPKGTAEDALALLKAETEEAYPGTLIEFPSLRTVQRELQRISQYVKDLLRYGPGYAERKNAAYYERRRPELPLEEVEVDHTTFDIILIDDESDIILGRPDVITIRDRATGVCLGFGIGWEVPSYAAFLEAVRHAMYPKDVSAFPGLKRPYVVYGRWKRMFVDNALHFLGLNIAHAAQQLQFELVELRPLEPWTKGAEERLFGILNSKIAHNLPGTTLSNVKERGDHRENLQKPTLTLKEFEAFFVTYIVDDYHWSPHEGLGPLRSLADVPMHLWQRDIDKVKVRSLPDPDTFVALAGDISERTIQHYGIEWDYIQYNSDDVATIRTNAKHKPGRGRHSGTRYKVTRDPQDIGRIWVYDPYRQRRFEIPAVRQDYAAGLTLHQHQIFIARHKEMLKRRVDIDGLLRVRAAMIRKIEEIRKQRKVQGTERKMARFFGGQKSKRVRSLVRPQIDSAAASAEPLDLEQPIGVVTPETRSKRAPNTTRRGAAGDAKRVRPMTSPSDGPPREGERPLVTETGDSSDVASTPKLPSLDELRARHPDWDEG